DQIRHQRRDPNQRHQHAESTALVLRGEKISLRDQAPGLRVPPHRGQQQIRKRIRDRAVAENVERRRAFAVRPAAAAKKGEGRVDLAGHQQEYEDRSEAAAADAPLLESHVEPAARQQAEANGHDERRGENGEGDAHALVPFASLLSEARRRSSVQMSHIVADVATTQSTIQKRRKGSPSTYGSARLANQRPASSANGGTIASQ